MGLTETFNPTAETKFQVTSYLLFLLKDKKKMFILLYLL